MGMSVLFVYHVCEKSIQRLEEGIRLFFSPGFHYCHLTNAILYLWIAYAECFMTFASVMLQHLFISPKEHQMTMK